MPLDKWMERENPTIPFERYADDMICHCKSRGQAEELKGKLEKRLNQVELIMHPVKTKIVYCKESGRNEAYSTVSFDFLGYTFQPRRSKNKYGNFFIGFSPGISSKAAKPIRQTSRQWRWPRRTDLELEDLARLSNPVVRGWINYYSQFYKSALHPTLLCLNHRLVIWATRKDKRFKGRPGKANHWLSRIARQNPSMFAHWGVLYRKAEQ